MLNDAHASLGLNNPNDASGNFSVTLDVMRKYNNVAQLRHFRGDTRGFKTRLTVCWAQVGLYSLAKNLSIRQRYRLESKVKNHQAGQTGVRL